MNCQLHETTTTYHCSQGAAEAEAKLMLAGIVTVPSNGFVFHHCATTTNPVGLLFIAKSNDNKVAM
jgi:hypothetical protein